MTDTAAKLDLDACATLTSGASLWSTVALPEYGIEAITMADGPMGVASGRVDERDVSTLTPCGTALAASWDVDLGRRIGALVGQDARRRGVDVVLAPNLNLPRSPLAGRAFELFSEDPLLTGRLGSAWIEGLQSAGVAASPKHIVGNDSETQRNTMNAVIDPRALREVYLLPFELAVQAGAWAILTAYNRLNGAYCAQHKALLTDMTKIEWRFDGVLLSDWFGVLDGVASVKAGLDLEMPGPPRQMGPKLASVDDVTSERLRDAAGRIARLSQRVHQPLQIEPVDPKPVLLEAAAAGFTLLKNDGILPISPDQGGKLVVIGPNAAAPCYQGGTFAKIAVRPDAETPEQSLKARFARRPFAFEPGVDPQPRLPAMPVAPGRDIGDGLARGMTVDYFAGHDFNAPPIFSETRDTNSLTWFEMPGDASPSSTGGIRASGVFTPQADGEHLLYVGATGPVRLLIDGHEVYRRDVQPPPSDLMGILKSGEAEATPVDLKVGRPVRVDVELRYAPFRAQGLWYGMRAPGDAASMLARAVLQAREADAVILVVGESSDSGVESRDRYTTLLEPRQLDLIDRVCAANANTVVVVNAAHAVDLSFADKVRAVMITWFPGEMFGPALAAVLAGDLEPGGRLPVTFAVADRDYPAYDLTPDAEGDLRYSEGWKIGYRSFQDRGVAPLYALGAGEGYTRFHLDDWAANKTTDDGVVARLSVRNVGARRGKAVIQAYLTGAGEDARVASLVSWATVELEADEVRAVEIAIAPRRFETWDEAAHAWRRPSGPRTLRVGLSSQDVAFEQVLS